MSKARPSIKKAPRARRQKTGSEVSWRAGAIASVRSGSSELRVEVLGDEIIVILPATSYGVTYYKPTHSAHLLVKNFLSKIDRGAPMRLRKNSSLGRGRRPTIKHTSWAGS